MIGRYASYVLLAGIGVTALCLVLPARTQDPPRHAGRLRDLLGAQTLTPFVVWRLTITWFRAFFRSGTGLRRVLTVLNVPDIVWTIASSRVRSRVVCVWEGRGDRFAMVILRLERDDSWTLSDLAAWPLGCGEAKGLVAHVMDAADKGAVRIRLRAANQRLASRYYVPLGFTFANGSEQHAKPMMERPPRTA